MKGVNLKGKDLLSISDLDSEDISLPISDTVEMKAEQPALFPPDDAPSCPVPPSSASDSKGLIPRRPLI